MKENFILTYKFIAIFSILTFDTISNSNGQGSQCTMKGTNISGQCKFIRNCPSEFHKLAKGQTSFTKCSASTPRKLVVCCPLPYRPRKITLQPKIFRLHEIKCRNYQKYVYNKRNIDTCGFKNTGLISGGEDAGPKEFPHMATLGYRINNQIKFQKCGGSLISERFILTAAHCMKSSNPEIVRLGDSNINSNDDIANPVDISVQEVIKHPQYRPQSKSNDIALIKLANNVTFDEYKRPACLPSEYDWNDINAMVTGWGYIDSYDFYGSDHLQKAKIQKFTQNECQEKLNTTQNRNNRIYKVSYSTQVCAGSKTDNKDTCPGDSGGPLQVLNSNLYCMWNIVGITSFGPSGGCGRKGIPGIYTRVFPYIDWIESIVWNK